jgi:hypothetical protein
VSSLSGSALYTTPGSYSLGGTTASVSESPDSSLQVFAPQYGEGSAQVTYYYSVQSYDGDIASGLTIPLIVYGSLSASAGGEGTVSGAQLAVGSAIGSVSASVASDVAPNTWGGFLDVSYLTGSGYASSDTIFIGVSASASDGNTAAAFAEAFADPYIEVDPSFAGASNYYIVVSDGIGNVGQASRRSPARWHCAPVDSWC